MSMNLKTIFQHPDIFPTWPRADFLWSEEQNQDHWEVTFGFYVTLEVIISSIQGCT